MISAYTRCSVRLYLQLFVGDLMSYLRYVCLLAHGGVQHIMRCAFALYYFVYVTSFSGLSICDCPFGILYRIFNRTTYLDNYVTNIL